MGFKPLGDRVYVKFLEEMEKTAGGLYIPEAAKEKPQRGKVEAVGKDAKELKVGDIVLFDKYAGSKIKEGSDEYLVIKEEEVLGVIS